jgi:hypothetical protein
VRIFYHNPISGKTNFLFTKCVMCGRKVLMRDRNYKPNRFNSRYFYCQNKHGGGQAG